MELFRHTDHLIHLLEGVISKHKACAQRSVPPSPQSESSRSSKRRRVTSVETPTESSRISARYLTPSTSSRTWKILSKRLHSENEDTGFWSQATGPLLAKLLQKAGYSHDAQYRALLFHYNVISSALGPRPLQQSRPRTWKSFMTDDFSPMELSWSWDDGTAQPRPKIRYSVEAIGAHAGTPADPLNQAETRNIIRQVKSISPTSHWQWFDSLSQTLCPSRLLPQRKTQSLWSGSDPSSMFLGFEFQEQGFSAKAYLAPTKAAVTGQSTLDVISEGIRSLETDTVKFPAYDHIISYLTQNTNGRSLEVLGIALDCIEPSKARLKLYARSSDTSFDTVREVMRMGGHAMSKSEKAMDDLWTLWQSVLGHGEEFSTYDQLQPNSHQTSGILYNFEIKAGIAATDPKVYIPVKHYSSSDREVVDGLTEFLRSHGRDGFASQYNEALESFCVHRPLEKSRGLQTYIQCGFQGDSISLTSYLAPEIYHPAKWSVAGEEVLYHM